MSVLFIFSLLHYEKTENEEILNSNNHTARQDEILLCEVYYLKKYILHHYWWAHCEYISREKNCKPKQNYQTAKKKKKPKEENKLKKKKKEWYIRNLKLKYFLKHSPSLPSVPQSLGLANQLKSPIKKKKKYIKEGICISSHLPINGLLKLGKSYYLFPKSRVIFHFCL